MEMNAIQIFQTITAGGVLATAATNLLNSPIVRIPFEKNKRLTAFMVSVVVTLAALYQQGIHNLSADWQFNIVMIIGTFITSSIIYNNISK